MKTIWLRSAWIALLLLISAAQVVNARPAVFANESLKTALEEAKQQDKIVVCDFTASWCGPCHQMDKVTWSDPKLIEWLTQNAITIQIDVDRETKLSQALRVEAMPTVVVFQPNQVKEWDRRVGLRMAPDLMPWLKAAKVGLKFSDMLKQQFFQAVADNNLAAEVNARKRLGDALLENKQYAEATEQFDWLWTNYDKDNGAFINTSHGKITPSIDELINKYKPARLRFMKIRDESEAKSRGDWIILNELLNQNQRTLDWFDKAKNDPSQQAEIINQRHKLESIFQEKHRWKEIAMVTPDPLEELDQLSGALSKLRLPISDQFDPLAEKTAIFYAAFLQDGKEELADKIARKGLTEDNTPHMRRRLAEVAWSAFQPRPIQLVWLWEAMLMSLPPWAPIAGVALLGVGTIFLIIDIVRTKFVRKT